MEIVEMDGKPFKLMVSNPNNRIIAPIGVAYILAVKK